MHWCSLWHYSVTAPIILEVLEERLGVGERLFTFVADSGFPGSLAAGSALKKDHPRSRIVATESAQSPTFLLGELGNFGLKGLDVRRLQRLIDQPDCKMLFKPSCPHSRLQKI